MFIPFFIVLILIFSGCQQKLQENHYTEITLEAQPEQPAASATAIDRIFNGPAETLPLTWKLPAGWKQGPANSMRLASFQLISNPSAFDCSIVVLPGTAGGLQANLKRWMGQIALDVSSKSLAEFMDASEDNIFDFTQLQKDEPPSTESMIAAALDINHMSVFVKLKGTIASVQKNKAAFVSLVKSIHLK